MASPTSTTQTITNRNWIILTGPERGGPLVTVGPWQRKAEVWSATSERGGFIGQSGTHSGGAPRGESFQFWEYDPDGQSEALEGGELRVERARFIGSLTSIDLAGFAGRLPVDGDLSLFGSRQQVWPSCAVSGNVDARFDPLAATMTNGAPVFRFNVTGNVCLQHWTGTGLDVSDAQWTSRGYGRIDGTLDMRYSRIASMKIPLALHKWHSIDLSRSRIETITAGVPGDLTLDHCTSLRSIGNGSNVGGNLSLIGTRLMTLPNALTVGGNLDLTDSHIVTLPATATIGGNVILRRARVQSLPEGWTVSGSVVR